MERQFLSLAEAAQSLGIGLTALRKLLDRGEIPSTHIGRRRLVPAAEIRRYAARIAASPDAAASGDGGGR